MMSMSSTACSNNKPLKPGKIRVGNRECTIGKDIIEMTDSTELYNNGDYKAVYNNLQRDGFVLLRGVIPYDKAINARHTLIDHLDHKNAITYRNNSTLYDAEIASVNGNNNNNKLLPGWTVDAINGYVIGNKESIDEQAQNEWHKLAQSSNIRGVYNSNELYNMYTNILITGSQNDDNTVIMQPDCTWLRMKGNSEVTAEHVDYYYFKNATTLFSDHWNYNDDIVKAKKQQQQNKTTKQKLVCNICNNSKGKLHTCTLCNQVSHSQCNNIKSTDLSDGEYHCNICADSLFPFYTCWISLSNLTRDGGSLCVLPQTQHLTGYNQSSRTSLLPGGYNKNIENNSIWQTPSKLQPGDIIMFNIKTIHGASKNNTSRFRLSIDTRLAVVDKQTAQRLKLQNKTINTSIKTLVKKNISMIGSTNNDMISMGSVDKVDVSDDSSISHKENNSNTGSFIEAAKKRRQLKDVDNNTVITTTSTSTSTIDNNDNKQSKIKRSSSAVIKRRAVADIKVTDGTLSMMTRRKRIRTD